MKYRKKPVVIDAHQVPPKGELGLDDLAYFLAAFEVEHSWCGKLHIKTLEGEITASPGDWIIIGVQGEAYPCKPDIFAATYECAE